MCIYIHIYIHIYVCIIHMLKGVGGVQDGWCVSVDMVIVHRDPVVAALHEPVHDQSSCLIPPRPFSGRRRFFCREMGGRCAVLLCVNRRVGGGRGERERNCWDDTGGGSWFECDDLLSRTSREGRERVSK